MKTTVKKILRLTVLILSLVALTACGSGSNDNDQTQNAEDETAFLMGSWFAVSAEYEGQEMEPDEVFGDTFSLYFSDDGKCTMWVGQNRALVDWEQTEEGVTLRGDDTYEITFPDESKETLIINLRGVNVVMEKYEE